ncbi:Spondin-1 (F-spondin) [Durusdinium trenchii]|uniref:Spondin-1 (F-spondin) n=1 Tax=Durusdinium trenchii TaxID=1381693 RepID=A0ABP0H692_9DINO
MTGSLTECPIRDCQISVLQSPKGPGMYCKAALVETAGCTAKDPDTCQVSEWTEWSICDRTCHGGQKYRQRELLHVASSSRSFCKEVGLFEGSSALCYCALCASQPRLPAESLDCLEHLLSGRGPPGNGLAYRNRVIVSPAGAQGTGCFGLTKDVSSFNSSVVKMNKVWGGWSHWSACSCSCGGGTKRRSRAIDLAPQSGGASCEPQEKEAKPCMMGQVPDANTCTKGWPLERLAPLEQMLLHLLQRLSLQTENMPSCSADSDCALSEWQHWSECSCSCNGIRERNRHISAYSRGQGLL